MIADQTLNGAALPIVNELVDYDYDLAGRLYSIANANVASATEPSMFVSNTLYNGRGQTTSITYGNGATSTYSYNLQRGFLTRVLSTNGATTLIDQTYTRNARAWPLGHSRS